MKPLLLVFFLQMLCLQKGFAASVPPSRPQGDSLSFMKMVLLTPKEITSPTGRKMSLAQKIQRRFLQKRLSKMVRGAKDPQKAKDTIATIALIAGIRGLVLLFLVPALGMFLMLVATVTGIIGLSNNSHKPSRTKALIGLIAGAVGIVFVGAIIIAFAIGYN